MATALKTHEWEAPFALSTKNDVNEQAPVRADFPGVFPARVIVREISFLMDSDGLQFLYRDAGPAAELPSRNIDALLPRLVSEPTSPFFGLADPGLAAETPLDLSVTGDPVYIVFKLDPRLNWRFSDNEAAISHKRTADAEHYGRLRHVRSNGTYSEKPIADCRMAFLIAQPPKGDYQHGFNFHVELIQKPHLGKNEPRILPIIIDPDIRFPGGSTT